MPIFQYFWTLLQTRLFKLLCSRKFLFRSKQIKIFSSIYDAWPTKLSLIIYFRKINTIIYSDTSFSAYIDVNIWALNVPCYGCNYKNKTSNMIIILTYPFKKHDKIVIHGSLKISQEEDPLQHKLIIDRYISNYNLYENFKKIRWKCKFVLQFRFTNP